MSKVIIYMGFKNKQKKFHWLKIVHKFKHIHILNNLIYIYTYGHAISPWLGIKFRWN